MSASPFVWGLSLAFLGAILILVTGQGTIGAALAGFGTAGFLVLGFGPGAMAPTALFVLGSGALTRLGRAGKTRAGVAEPHGGRRGAANVLAKLGIPALLGLFAALEPSFRATAGTGAAAALAGAFADTAATEVGPVIGGPVVRFQGARVVKAAHGETGGVSAAGLAAGAAAAILTAILASAVGLGIREGAPYLVAGAGFLAMLLESGVAASAIGRRVGHFGRNILLSALAAAAGCVVAR